MKLELMSSHSFHLTKIVTLGLAVICVVTAVTCKRFLYDDDPSNCHALRDHGNWVSSSMWVSGKDTSHWQLRSCMMHTYTSYEVEECFESTKILFIGDSIARSIFWAAAKKFNSTIAGREMAMASKHSDLYFDTGVITLDFLWDPYLNTTFFENDFDVQPVHRDIDRADYLIVVSSGLWYARFLGPEYLHAFETTLGKALPRLVFKGSKASQTSNISRTVRAEGIFQVGSGNKLALTYEGSKRTTLFLPLVVPDAGRLNRERTTTLTPNRINALNAQLELRADNGEIDLLRCLSLMTSNATSTLDDSGIHLQDHVAATALEVILNLDCNKHKQFQHYPYDRSCCTPQPSVNALQMTLILMSISSLIGRLLVFMLEISRRESLSNIPQKNVLDATTVISLTILYCFCADRTSLFQKTNKTIHQPRFLTLATLVLLAGAFSVKGSTKCFLSSHKSSAIVFSIQPFLSRQQSEEWKGWMQMIILLYHYFGMSNILWVYKVVRVLVSAYLFMTSFGHTVYFLRTHDFSIHRVSRVMIRLNLLSILLAYVMRTSYNFYYFPALSSFWFFMVMLTLRIRRQGEVTSRSILSRIGLSMLLVKTFIEYPGVLETSCLMLRIVFKVDIDVYEFRFRVCLDFYIVYLGMIVGWIYHHLEDARSTSWACLGIRIYEHSALTQFLVMAGCLVVLSSWFIAIQNFSDKHEYNKWHPVISPLPVIAFLVLRNATPFLRNHYMRIFVWLGRCSLETFVLQYHIWLAGDTKGLLILGLWKTTQPFSYWAEFGIVTIVFFWVSWAVSKATTTLTDHILIESTSRQDRLVRPPDHEHTVNTWRCRWVSGFKHSTRIQHFNSSIRLALILSFLCLANWMWQT